MLMNRNKPLIDTTGPCPGSMNGQLYNASRRLGDVFFKRYQTYDGMLRTSINDKAPHKFSIASLKDKTTTSLQRTLMTEWRENKKGKNGEEFEFSSAGGIVIQDLTNQMLAVIQEDYNQNIFAETYLDRMFPDRGVFAHTIDFDVIAAPGGLMDPYTYGSAVPERGRLANRTISYTGAAYRNYINFNEHEILFMRKLGTQPYDTRGILQRVAYNILKLKTLSFNRKQVIKSTIFDGQVTINPNAGPEYIVDYQIPVWNVVTNITAQTWATYNETTGSLVVNPLADPIFDLLYFLNAYEPWFTRRDRLNRCTLVMNPITQLMLVKNPSIRATMVALQTSTNSPVAPQAQYTVSNIISSLLTGWEGQVVIEGAGYLEEDSSVSWAPDSKFTATAPPQRYFVPTGQVFFHVEPLDYPLGELIYQPQLQQGGLEAPQPGDWVVAQPLIGAQFPEGLERPVFKVVGGFQAGLAPVHVENVLIGNFGTVTT